jgi:hypothetical protein
LPWPPPSLDPALLALDQSLLPPCAHART